MSIDGRDGQANTAATRPVLEGANAGPVLAVGVPPLTYDQLVHTVTQLPLLSQQTLYVLLRRSLETRLNQHTLERLDADNLLQLWVPHITPQGVNTIQQLADRQQTSHPLYRLLRCVQTKQTVSQMCILNGWSLVQGCMLLQQAFDKEWLVSPTSQLILGAIHFITDTIRLGEFLHRLGKISAEQLDQALKAQQYAWEVMGQRSAIGNVLMNLGYVNRDDIEGILLLKQESKRPLFFS
jgi:hypothetical protein